MALLLLPPLEFSSVSSHGVRVVLNPIALEFTLGLVACTPSSAATCRGLIEMEGGGIILAFFIALVPRSKEKCPRQLNSYSVSVTP